MKTLLLSFIFLVISITSGLTQVFYAVGPQGGDLYQIDRSTGTIINTASITSEQGQIQGFVAMARENSSGSLWAVARISGNRHIGLLDLNESTFSALALLNDKISGIAFDESGVCYGITGDGATNPSVLYSINVATGELTEILNVSSIGSDGEAIAYNELDGLIYRYAGGQILQTIEPFTLETVEFTIATPLANYGHAMYYDDIDDALVLAAGPQVFSLSLDGMASNAVNAVVGDDDGIKGIVRNLDVTLVQESSKPKVMNVYPNPSNGIFNLTNTTDLNEISVLDLSGRIVYSSTEIEPIIELDVPAGIYNLRAFSQTGTIENIRIILE